MISQPVAVGFDQHAELEQVAAAQLEPAAGHEFAAGRARPLAFTDTQRPQQPLVDVPVEGLAHRALNDLAQQQRSTRAIRERPAAALVAAVVRLHRQVHHPAAPVGERVHVLFVADVVLVEVVAVERGGHGGKVHERDGALEGIVVLERREVGQQVECRLFTGAQCAVGDGLAQHQRGHGLRGRTRVVEGVDAAGAEVALEDQPFVPVHQHAGGVRVV